MVSSSAYYVQQSAPSSRVFSFFSFLFPFFSFRVIAALQSSLQNAGGTRRRSSMESFLVVAPPT